MGKMHTKAERTEKVEEIKAENRKKVKEIRAKKKEELMKQIARYSLLYDFDAVVPVSAQDGNGMNELLDELKKQAGEGGHFFDDDTLTDQPERVIVAEIISQNSFRHSRNSEESGHGFANPLLPLPMSVGIPCNRKTFRYPDGQMC